MGDHGLQPCGSVWWAGGRGPSCRSSGPRPTPPQLTARPACKGDPVGARKPLGFSVNTGLCSLALCCGPHVECPGALRIQGRAPQVVRGFGIQEGSVPLQRSRGHVLAHYGQEPLCPLRYGGQARLHLPKLKVGCKGGSPEMKGDVTNRHKPKPGECPLPASECPQA